MNPALNPMHVLNVGRRDVMHFNHPAQSQQHVTHKAFLVSQICHLSQMLLYEIVSDKRRVFSLQICVFVVFFLGGGLLCEKLEKTTAHPFEEEETSDKILNKLKKKKKTTLKKTLLMVRQPHIYEFRL